VLVLSRYVKRVTHGKYPVLAVRHKYSAESKRLGRRKGMPAAGGGEKQV